MKKIISIIIIIATVMMFIGLAVLAAAPANASETMNQAICHFDNGNGFVQIVVSKSSIVKKNGDEGGHGKHAEDIVPPFEYNFGGNDNGNYVGSNWTPESQKVWANDCKPIGNVLTPVLPAPVLGTCVNPAGTIVKPEQSTGVEAFYEFKNGNYVVTFSKPANTVYNTYSFPVGFTNPATVKVTAPGHGDQYWDDKKGGCNLPDTGASGISTNALVVAGGLIFLGLLAFSVTSFMGRRKKA